jgi:hypothetical protein
MSETEQTLEGTAMRKTRRWRRRVWLSMGRSAMSDKTTAVDERIDSRSERALCEYMTVLPVAPDVCSVTTESGSEYRVDARAGRCECPDARHNLGPSEACKHERRVAFATGARPIPTDLAETGRIDPALGEHVDATPVLALPDGGAVPVDGESERGDDSQGRPDDCRCENLLAGASLPCWPCWREGFEEPAASTKE